MRELYIEGVATRDGPESGIGTREGAGGHPRPRQALRAPASRMYALEGEQHDERGTVTHP